MYREPPAPRVTVVETYKLVAGGWCARDLRKLLGGGQDVDAAKRAPVGDGAAIHEARDGHRVLLTSLRCPRGL
jgi:hypothetical protein